MQQPQISLTAPLNSTDLAWRILTLVNVFRLALPTVLALMFVTIQPAPIGRLHSALFVATMAGYFLFGLAAITSIRQRWPRLELQAVAQALVDIAAMSLVLFASGSLGGGYAAMLVFPVGATALIVPSRLGLFLAAVAAIALLFVQGMILWAEDFSSGDFVNAGVIGGLIFVVTLSVTPLAKRLRESEALIRQRDFDIANLAELNEFIVQHLRESILVVDENDRIRLINESAGQLLKGDTVTANTILGEVSPRLLYLLDNWRRHGSDWRTSTLSLVAAGGGAVIQPHFVSLDPNSRGPTLVFLEDTSVFTERLQQSKLAALGRLSASIAHEVRNPVGAMSHAAQLLAESSTLSAQDQRLIEIIIANGERVGKIIGNVLQLSRREATNQERVDLNGWLRDFASEFRQTQQLDEHALLVAAPFHELAILVDASHLHQVVWNLCENAVRYGRVTHPNDPVKLRTGRIPSTSRPYLEVVDHGPGIPLHDVERIFEPFFTTGQGGTGLGLFIARELAQANGAVLLYEPAAGGGSIFRLIFTDPQRWEL
jgi:two-component system, NtrC family, sensor histidine kinase PilS